MGVSGNGCLSCRAQEFCVYYACKCGRSGTAAGVAAAGTAGVVIAGGMAAGWNVLGIVAENLPWVGVAYHMLNEIADMVDTKHGMEVN